MNLERRQLDCDRLHDHRHMGLIGTDRTFDGNIRRLDLSLPHPLDHRCDAERYPPRYRQDVRVLGWIRRSLVLSAPSQDTLSASLVIYSCTSGADPCYPLCILNLEDE